MFYLLLIALLRDNLAWTPSPVPDPPRLVRVNASVYDHNGKPLTDLRQEEFTVLELGRKQPIERFLTPKAPLKIVLLVDTSLSMFDFIGPVRESLIDFVVSLGPYDEVSVISFSNAVSLETDFTFSTDRLRNALTKLELSHDPHDRTKLYDAVAIALERLEDQSNARTALIVVTDGQDRGSKEAGRDETIELGGRSFVTVYPIYATRRSSGKNEYLEWLAAVTGGEVYRTDKTLDRHLGELSNLLRHHYILGYTSSSPQSQKDPYLIEVRVSRENTKVIATKSYRVFFKR